MKKIVVCSAWVAFVATVVVANWLVKHYGPVRVWPTALLAPAGVYAAGLAFLLRDTLQRLAGNYVALAGIAAGTVLSVFIATPELAFASASAFAASEAAGLAFFWLLGGTFGGPGRVLTALVTSSLVAAAIDSWLFLTLAFHNTAFFNGQFVGKVSVTALALPLVLLARRSYAAPRVATA